MTIKNLETIIAERINKTVYKKGDLAVKVFDQSFPKSDVLNEALNQARVEETGLNIPKVQGVITTENGEWGIELDYIEGKTLEEIMNENPDKEDEYLEQFVELQLEIHQKSSPLLNRLKSKLDGRISKLSGKVSASIRYELHTRLAGMPKHEKVLHGDFDPSNVVFSNDGKIYILDWAHATQGNASADAATTYLLLVLKGKEQLAEKYLALFCEKTDTAKQYVQRWLPIIAACRLLKEVPEEEELLMRWLDVVDYE